MPEFIVTIKSDIVNHVMTATFSHYTIDEKIEPVATRMPVVIMIIHDFHFIQTNKSRNETVGHKPYRR